MRGFAFLGSNVYQNQAPYGNGFAQFQNQFPRYPIALDGGINSAAYPYQMQPMYLPQPMYTYPGVPTHMYPHQMLPIRMSYAPPGYVQPVGLFCRNILTVTVKSG